MVLITVDQKALCIVNLELKGKSDLCPLKVKARQDQFSLLNTKTLLKLLFNGMHITKRATSTMQTAP